MLKIWSHPVGAFQINAILVWCEQTDRAVLFDPGAESERIFSEIDERHLTLQALVNTHGHVDHIAENRIIKEHSQVPLLIHRLDRPMLLDPALNLSLFTGNPITSPDADGELNEGDELPVGEETMQVLHVPGHTPGSLVFYYPGMLIAGDTLFAGGVGRTDFPRGSESILYGNIRKKLYTLPDDTVVYPGHGPTTTIGEERRTNPFVRA